MDHFKNKLKELFSKTGDSELKKSTYENGKFFLTLKLFNENILKLEFKTETLYCKNIEQRTPFNIGHLDCTKLSDVLIIENNHYSLSGGFVDLMKAQRNKYTLALGLSLNNYTHIITFSNSSIILAFLIHEKENYEYEIE